MDQVLRSILLEMKQHTGLLTSINENLAKLNASTNLQQFYMKFDQFEFVSFCLGKTSKNKLEDEGNMKTEKGEQKVTKKEEVMCDSYQVKQLHESPAPWLSSCSSRTEEKKYRLHIVGDVCHEAINENGRLKMNVIRGKQIPRIEVILKHGVEQVPATHHLASLRVELVVLDAKYHIEESTDWPRKEFEDHFMPVAKAAAAAATTTTMTVHNGVFSLDGGRKVCTFASINESSWKQKVRLGVTVVNGGAKERVLEGVSSNKFYVIHERRREATCANKGSKRQAPGNSELHPIGKRVNSDTTMQPRTSYLQFSSPQIFGQHAAGGEQPSHAINACWTQNRPTTPIDAGYMGGAQAYAPNSGQGLAASAQTVQNHGEAFVDAEPEKELHDTDDGHSYMDGLHAEMDGYEQGDGGRVDEFIWELYPELYNQMI